MHIRNTLLSLFAMLLMATTAVAQLSATESFDYAAGLYPDADLGSASNGFGGSWYLDPNDDSFLHEMSSVSAEGLMYDDLDYMAPHVGNHMQVNNPGGWQAARYFRPLAETWPDEAGAEYWVSLIFQADAIPTGNTYYLMKLYKDDGEIMAIGKGGGGTTYTLGSGWPGGSGDNVSDVECLGDPVWLVVKIVASGDDNSERAYMWISPDPSVEPDTADANIAMSPTMNDGFNTIALECGGEDVMVTHWDEMRLGTSFADVTGDIAVAMAATESFDYSVGLYPDADLGSAGNGFSGSWYLDPNDDSFVHEMSSVSEEGLMYDDLDYMAPHVGNHMQVNNPGGWQAARYFRPLAQTWPSEAGAEYWVSLIFQADNVPTGNTYYLMKLYKDDGEIIAFGKGGGGTTYSCGSGWPGGAGDDVSDVECLGDPVWMVAKLTAVGDGTNFRTHMWISPDPSVEPDTAEANVARNTGMASGFNMIALECGGEDVMVTHWDEFRIGTSFASVTGDIMTDIAEPTGTVPTEYALAQNYPNPFNPSTTISFSIPQESNVTLRVFDIIGREVTTLIRNESVAAGTYRVSFNASGLSSGTYFYQLQTDKKVETRKMLLVK